MKRKGCQGQWEEGVEGEGISLIPFHLGKTKEQKNESMNEVFSMILSMKILMNI